MSATISAAEAVRLGIFKKGRRRKKVAPLLRGAGAAAGSIHLTTVPPSLNNAFKNVRAGRVATLHYKLWRESARIELMQQPQWHVAGPVEVDIYICRDQTRADLDNLTKALLDLLVVAGRISDDRHVLKITTQFSAKRGCTVNVQAKP